jgi:DNA-binding beta-propeller fold protein YncE
MNKRLFLFYLLIGICYLHFIACTRHISKGVSADNIVIFPPPPDTTRIQYLTSISNSQTITGKRPAFARFIFGEYKQLSIVKPYGIAIHDGKIYICDTGIDALEIIDLEKHSFEYFNPTGFGQFKKPLNCFVDEDGYLYVADGGRNQILIFDTSGIYVNSFGEPENFKPTDVFVYEDKIWVTNFVDNKIHVYSKDSNRLLYTLPDSESGNEDFLYSPSNLYVTNDRIYVSDFGDFKIKLFTLEGEFIMSVGSYGEKIGQFVRPKGIAVDHDQNLYVVDAGFENTQIFSKEGKLLMFFGGPYKGSGDLWLPAKVVIDYDNLKYFQSYVDERFILKYLILVTSQYGPDKINVYGYVEPKL